MFLSPGQWMMIFYSILLVAISTAAVTEHIEDDNQDVNDGVVEEEAGESVVVREKPVYERPIPSQPTYFCEPFDTRAEFLKRWVYSQAKKGGAEDHLAKYDGKWTVEEPINSPIENDLGLILKSKAKHHAIAAKLDKPFEFNGKPFIAQYEVKFQSGMDCGGAYIKLLSHSDDLNLKSFTDRTPYTIMFGPDKCGNDHKLHFIFRHKNPKTGEYEEKHADKPTVKLENYFVDRKTHLFTLIVNPDNTYEIRVDKEVVAAGSLLSNFSPPVNPPNEIDDPSDQKPAEWDDREKIPDPLAQKPDDWDESEPATILDENAVMPDGWLEDEELYIPDPAAVKPDDWDVDVDGEWEPPQIDNPRCKDAPGCGKWVQPAVTNPKYKGIWSAPMIDNPIYNGVWIHRKIPNPDYFEDHNPYNMTPIGAVGLELWSMTENIIFDNFIIADNVSVVERFTAITWELKNIQEKKEHAAAGWWNAIKSSARDRPWLWIVYSFVIVLPILLLLFCLCPRPGSTKPKNIDYRRKKFDYPMPDVRDAIKGAEDNNRNAGEGTDIGQAGIDSRPALDGTHSTDDQDGDGQNIPSAGSPKKSGSPRKRTTKKE